MRFEHPWLLLVLAAIPLWFVWSGMRGWRRASVLWIRSDIAGSDVWFALVLFPLLVPTPVLAISWIFFHGIKPPLVGG